MEPSPGRCKDHQFQEAEQIRSLVFLWVCKQALQSTVVFSVSGIVELYPSITSRKTGGLEALLFLANTASRRILWWTWIRCFFLLFTSNLVWWRISWRRYTIVVLHGKHSSQSVVASLVTHAYQITKPALRSC